MNIVKPILAKTPERVIFVARASPKMVDFFIEVPVEKQLQNFLAGKVFCAFLL